MAYVISDLDPRFAPLPSEDGKTGNEKIVFVYLIRKETGFCVKAVTPAETGPGGQPLAGREIGRWVSDCPLAVVTTALLWLSQSEWEIHDGHDGSLADGIAFNEVFDTVPEIADRSVHPQSAIETLRRNFPPKPGEGAAQPPAVRGARIELGARRPAPPALSGPVAAAPVAAAPPVAKAPRTEPAVTAPGDAEIVSAIRSLRKGDPPGITLRTLAHRLGFDHRQILPAVDDLGPDQAAKVAVSLEQELRSLRNGADPAQTALAIATGLGIKVRVEEQLEEAEPDLDAIDRELAIAEAAEPTPASAPMGVRVAYPMNARSSAPGTRIIDEETGRVLRPLRTGEVPPGLSPEQQAEFEGMAVQDDSIARKLADTARRAQAQHDRVERALAAKRVRDAAELEARRQEAFELEEMARAAEQEAAEAELAEAGSNGAATAPVPAPIVKPRATKKKPETPAAEG
jgi:hypothetical protein